MKAQVRIHGISYTMHLPRLMHHRLCISAQLLIYLIIELNNKEDFWLVNVHCGEVIIILGTLSSPDRWLQTLLVGLPPTTGIRSPQGWPWPLRLESLFLSRTDGGTVASCKRAKSITTQCGLLVLAKREDHIVVPFNS